MAQRARDGSGRKAVESSNWEPARRQRVDMTVQIRHAERQSHTEPARWNSDATGSRQEGPAQRHHIALRTLDTSNSASPLGRPLHGADGLMQCGPSRVKTHVDKGAECGQTAEALMQQRILGVPSLTSCFSQLSSFQR